MGFSNNIEKNRKQRFSAIRSGLGKTLFMIFLAISLVPLTIVSYIGYRTSYNNLYEDAVNSLSAVSNLKKKYIESYFSERLQDLSLQAQLNSNRQVFGLLRTSFMTSGMTAQEFVNSDEWKMINEERCLDLRNFKNNYSYADLFFIDYEGNILFSAMDHDDLGSNIFSGKYSKTLFGKACRKAFASGKSVFSDFEAYEPAGDSNVGFFVHTVRNDLGEKIGLMADCISVSEIDAIMQERTGLGETGESYLIGEDLIMRTNSRFFTESGIGQQVVDTHAGRQWLKDKAKWQNNESGYDDKIEASIYKDYRGVDVLGTYNGLEITGVNLAMLVEIDKSEAFSTVIIMRKLVIMLLIATVALVVVVSILITRQIVFPIRKLTDWARGVAVGDMSYNENITNANNEIGMMADCFKEVVHSFKQVTTVCEAVAIGDFHKMAKIKSEKDRLGKAVNQMAENLHAIVEQVESVTNGDYSVEIKPHSDHDHLGVALLDMTKALKDVKAENDKKNWLRNHRVELNDRMRGEQDINVLIKNMVTYITECLDAKIGAAYLTQKEGNALRLAGSYGYTKRKNLSSEFKVGEGLVGQAALEKQTIIITNVPDDYIKINSGLGEAPPKNILVMPLIYDDEVVGVIELGSFNEFTDIQMEFLNLVGEGISIAINSAEARTLMENLLEETQRQAEILETQQEELRQTNEELEEQTKALKESEERLKLQQEELQQTNEELEEQTQALEKQKDGVRKKNVELENSRAELKTKAEALELSSKYKSEFLANMSHELRTPLNSILILSKILSDNKSKNFTEKQVELAATINSAGNDLLNLINDILDLSKVESGKMKLHIEFVGLEDFANNVKRKVGPVAAEKGLEFNVDISKGLPDGILTDRQRLDQIIKNFLSNAIKFTDKGSVSLNIFRPRRDIDLLTGDFDPDKTLAISVADTGIGIPKEKQDLIFEAFQQADGTTSRKYGGTGLGLSISREFVKLLGGEIKLKSEYGKGSAFTIYLPEEVEGHVDPQPKEQKTFPKPAAKKEVESRPAPKPQASEDGQAAVPAEKPADFDDGLIWDDRKNLNPGDKSVLVIEDDTNFARILFDLANEKGFKCLAAENGETGLYMADYYKPSAIILDVGLPGIDGLSVMERLKSNPATRHIPVNFISGSENNLDAMRMGAIGYLTKPVSVEMLDDSFKKIEGIISKKVKKLLVVEDNEDMRKSITELIGNGDVNTTGVSSGQEAHNLLKSGEFDCMVLDIGLSDMSGFDLLDKIRNDKSISYIPVIIYTGKELSRDEEEMLTKYADSVIIKGAKSPERLLDETALFMHRVEANLPEDKQNMIKMAHDRERGSVFSGKTVLLVDDDMRNVFALTHVIEDKGMDIVVAKNGKECLGCLDKNPDVDIVLMDIMMPEMDGYEATRQIRKQEKFRKLPIIAITAKAMAGDKNKCIEAGANDYLSKPIDTDKLVSLLKVWLY